MDTSDRTLFASSRSRLARAARWSAGLILVVCAGTSPAAVVSGDPTGLVIDQMITVKQAGVPNGQLSREFRYYRPANLKGPVPMIVYYHGGSLDTQYATGSSAVSKRWMSIADAQGALIVFPNGTKNNGKYTSGAYKGLSNLDTTGRDQQWNDCRRVYGKATPADDVAFTRALVRWAETRTWASNGGFTVDPQRIYVTGASNGGAMVQRLALEASDIVAGGASFIANLPTDANNQCTTSPSRFVPLFMLFGTADKTMVYGGNAANCASAAVGCVRSAEETRLWWIQQVGAPYTGVVPSSCPASATMAATGTGETRCAYPDVMTNDGGSSGSSRVYSLLYAVPGSTPIQVLTVDKGGHLEPSVSVSQALYQLTLGAQNRDVESVDEAWNFLRNQVCASCVAIP
jgi:polyhydroxybutyrate depolymerase